MGGQNSNRIGVRGYGSAVLGGRHDVLPLLVVLASTITGTSCSRVAETSDLNRTPRHTPVPVPPSSVARTVLLVDDHPGFRRMARLLLRSGGYDVVGEASTAVEAVASAEMLQPDLMLVDVLLPDGSGVDVAGALAALSRPPGVVLISSRERCELGLDLAHSPVLGFVQKDALTVDRLVELFG